MYEGINEGRVFYPEQMSKPTCRSEVNLSPHDPAQLQLEETHGRLALYELEETHRPNNGAWSGCGLRGLMKWLCGCGGLRLNPQIPRQVAEDISP